MRSELGGLRRVDRPGLQPAARLGEAGAAQPRLGLLGAAKFQVALEPLEVGRERARARRPRRSLRACAATLPSPPHWATRRPPGRSAACRRAKSRSWSSDPVEDGAGEDRVDRLGAARARSGRRPGRSTRSPSRSRAFSIIDAEPSTAITRPRAGARSASAVTRPLAAAGVEHGLLAAQLQPVEHLLPHSTCGTGDRGRRSRRPSRGSPMFIAPARAHSAVVTGPRGGAGAGLEGVDRARRSPA